MLDRVILLLGTLGVTMSLVMPPCSSAEEPASPDEATGGERVEASATPASATSVVEASVPDAGPPDTGPPPPPPPPALAHAPWGTLSPITPAVAAHLRSLRERNPHLADNVFMKMGGSSIAAHAFLYCLRGDQLDLGDHPEIEEALEFFGGGNAGGRSPFTRESEAAEVGWSIRHGMTGRPPRVQREIEAIRPRYALAFFGGNDVEARRPRQWGQRLERLVDFLQARGIVPVLGATMPRGEPDMDEVARAYNRVTRAIALSRNLPFIDFYGALDELPGRGLASDGVHPNVHIHDGRGRACHFSEEALIRGHNVRNLLTMQMLDGLRRVVSAGEEAPAPALPQATGEGTLAAPRHIPQVPFAEVVDNEQLATPELAGCDEEHAPVGRARVYRVRLEEPMELRALVVGGQRLFRPAVSVLSDPRDVGTCAGYDDEGEAVVSLSPGTWHFLVDAGDEEEQHYTFSLDAADR